MRDRVKEHVDSLRVGVVVAMHGAKGIQRYGCRTPRVPVRARRVPGWHPASASGWRRPARYSYTEGEDNEYDWYQDRDHDGIVCER